MASLARANPYLRKQSVLKAVKENASTSSAFEGVRAAARGGAFHYKTPRSKTASRGEAAPRLKPHPRRPG